MVRDEILSRIQQCLKRMDKWDINTYRYAQQEMNQLNPAFGFRDTDNSNNRSRTKGVMSVWMRGGAKDITVNILPHGYNGPDMNLKTHDLTDQQLESILQWVEGLWHKEIQRRKQAAMNPKLEDLIPRLEFWSKQFAAAAGPQYSAFISLGKRAFENEKYHAIVIYENNDQIGSISLKQSEDGGLTYNERTPLGGQWAADESLSIRNILTPIRDSIASIVGKKIELDTAFPQKLLLDNIRKDNRKWADSGMTFDLQVKRGEGMIPERWKINFNHQFISDHHVELKMTGTLEGVENSAPSVIAEGVYNPEQPADWLLMEGYGEQTELLAALAQTGKIEEIDRGETLSHGKWIEADIRALYDDWLRQMNTAYLFSPVDKVQLVAGPNPQHENELTDYIHCEVGGILMEPQPVNQNDAELLQKIKERPQYTFLEQRIAHKIFSSRLTEYYENKNRISDIRVSQVNRNTYIRCRIDGAMQLRQQLPESLRKVLKESDNPEATLVVLAEQTFRNQLKQQQSRGLKR